MLLKAVRLIRNLVRAALLDQERLREIDLELQQLKGDCADLLTAETAAKAEGNQDDVDRINTLLGEKLEQTQRLRRERRRMVGDKEAP